LRQASKWLEVLWPLSPLAPIASSLFQQTSKLNKIKIKKTENESTKNWQIY